jgi:DNA polymerase III delta prime subunit
MNSNNDQFMWSERYRPLTIEDCIIPAYLKETFQAFIEKGEVQHMIFSGPPGVGKTTVAMALADGLGCDYIVINGSSENGIEVLRTKITAFASSVSLNGKSKIVIIDEADGLGQKIQDGLRSFLEAYAKNCRFIFTCNQANRIIEAIRSRCGDPIEFRITKDDRPMMAAKFMKRVAAILIEEGVESDKKVVAQIVSKYFPDFRKTLNVLQRYSVRGPIDEGILINDVDIKDLMEALKAKDFKVMRQWVANNVDNDSQKIFRQVFDTMLEVVVEVPQTVLIIADYTYKDYFVADKMINMTACFTELMASVTFKK